MTEKIRDIECEQALLGGLLHHNSAVNRVATFLHPEHFSEPLHQRVYESIVRAVRAGRLASAVTLKHEFGDDKALAELGGTEYLVGMMSVSMGSATPFENMGRLIFDLAFRRHMIDVARELQLRASQVALDESAETLARYAERVVNDAVDTISGASSERFASVRNFAAAAVRSVTDPQAAHAVPYGLSALDDIVGGLRPKELTIVGARPGMGKTAFAGHLALSAAKAGHRVAFFSMEMSGQAIGLRLLTAEAFATGTAIAYEALRKGQMKPGEDATLFEAEGSLSQLPIDIHEGRGLTPAGIVMATKRLRDVHALTKHPVGLVIVDHLQKIKPDRDLRGNKVGEMTEISDALQKMAGTLDLPVVALSQLNRQVEGQGNDRRPELSHLRESGSIEQDADVVLLLYRHAYYVRKREPSPPGTAEHAEWHAEWLAHKHKLDIHVAKHRNGAEGRCTVYFDAPSSALRNL